MNERIKQLAEQAGFMLWQDEAHNPGDVVDWAARYDDELVKYTELIVLECASVCYNSGLEDSDAHALNLMVEFNIDNCRNDK